MRHPFSTHALSLGALGAAILLRWLLDPVMGESLPLVTLFGAVAVAVWLGGYRPAVLVTVLGYVACDYLFIPPRGRLALVNIGNLVGALAYLFTCAVITAFGEAMRRAQARASERGEVLRVTLASIGDAVITTDMEGRVTYLNTVAEALTGWPPGDARGRPLDEVFRIVNEETRRPVENPALRALSDGVVVGLANHTLLLKRDGGECPIDDSAAPIRDEGGHVSGAVLIFRDVAAQRRQEQEKAGQLHTARMLATIVESSDDAIISKSLDGVIQSWNAAAERLFGFTAAQAVGRHISLIIPPDRMKEEDHILASLAAGRQIDHYETERMRSDGRRILVSLTISPLRDEAGKVTGASKIARDVTLQREAEERERRLLGEAAEANAKFRAFFDQGALFAAIVGLDGTVLDSNRSSWEGCGYTREQVAGRRLWDGPWWSKSAELRERIKAGTQQAAAGEVFRAEVPYVVADGGERMAGVTLLPIRDESGGTRFVAFTGADITDRKRAEADREKFVTLVENSTDFIGMCDLDAVPFFVNRAGLEMVGLDGIEEARRTPVQDFFFPEDQPRIMDEFFPAVLQDGHGEVEVRFRHFKTGEARWMAYKVVMVADAAGQPTAFATVSQDVTERRRMEDDLRKLAADLSETARRKDEFLALLAHELRNPLAPLSNAVQVLRRAGADEGAVQASAEMLERQVRQMTRLVDDLLDMSRITQGKIELRRERVELGPIVEQAVEAARGLYASLNHELTVSTPAQPVLLDADPARLAQVIGNLLNNAAKFTDRGGQVRLTVERDGPQVAIAVRDNGIGIAHEQLPRLFDMFVQLDTSLERSRDGLGIGLTLARSLVERHGGTVEAHSEGLGHGSEFVVRLPALDETRAPQPKAPAAAPAAAPGRRVLIVDDNADGAESLALLLQLGGYETHTAHDGFEALEAAERLRPHAVLLDIGLPGLNGYEVCRRIRAQPWGRDVTVVAVTGWGQDVDRHRSREAGFDTHIVKPVDPDGLLRLLASR